MLFLKVPRKIAEKTRRELMERGLLSKNHEIIPGEEFVLLPVLGLYGDFEIVEMEAQERETLPKTLRGELSGLLTEEELQKLTTSFDIVGDIAIVEIPGPLEMKERKIGEALLKVHKNLKTVLKKLGGMEGEFRVRRLACIAGADRTETTYLESGLKMKLDVSKVYFSVRLAHERTRIADLAEDGERVLVLFAGVGPFALVIAKQHPKAKIVAVELNPDAVRYMRENIKLNRLKNVEAVEADAGTLDFAGMGGAGSFDRAIMPLPKSAHEFLGVAFAALRDGGTVHFYTIVGADEPFAEALGKAQTEAKNRGVSLQVLSQRIVRPYSPSQVQVVLDLRVIRKM